MRAPAFADPACRIGVSVQAHIDLTTRMEHARTAVGQRNDVAAVIPFTEDDYTQIDPDSQILDRSATFGRISGSQMRLDSNSLGHIIVRISGKTAIVTGQAHPRGTFQGKTFDPDIA